MSSTDGLFSSFQHTAARRRLGPTVQQGVNTVEFQHTAARRRLAADSNCRCASDFVSTHSRPKAAGGYSLLSGLGSSVSTHSRPKAAGRNQPAGRWVCMVSTHSRPKAAGLSLCICLFIWTCFNTQPPEGGWSLSQKPCSIRFRSPDFAKLLRKA